MLYILNSPQSGRNQRGKAGSRRFIRGLLLVALAPLITLATAEPPGTVVVTGTLTEKTELDSPVPIQVVDNTQLLETQVESLDEVLKQIPGVSTQDMHGQQGQSVMMQGMDANHVLILIDGLPLKQTSDALNVERLPLNNVKQIEVVPGNASALYGAQAMGGVINIITEQPEADYESLSLSSYHEPNVESPWFSSRLAFNGGFGRSQFGFSGADAFSDTQINLQQFSGLDLTPNDWEAHIANGYRWQISQQFLRRPEPDHLRQWLFEYLGGRLTQPYTQSIGPSTTDRFKQENSDEYRIQYRHQQPLALRAFALEYDQYQSQQILASNDQVTLDRMGYSALASLHERRTFELAEREITLGGVLSSEFLTQVKVENDLRLYEVPETFAQSVELFMQDDWFVGEKMEVVSGLRGQVNSRFGGFFSPRLALRFDINEHFYARLSSGTGYRVPTVKELFFYFDHSLHGYQVIGNEDLKPETSWGNQVEFGGQFAGGHGRWSMNFFHQKINNLIETALSEQDGPLNIYRYQNIGEAETFGVTNSIKWPVSIFQTGSLELSHEFLQATDLQTGEALIGRPDHRFTLNYRQPLAKQRVIRIQGAWQGRQTTDAASRSLSQPFATVDVFFNQQLSQQWRVSASIKNLTNEIQDVEAIADPRPFTGQTFQVTAQYQFQ